MSLIGVTFSVSGFSSRCGTFISVCDQPPRSTQPGHPFVGRRNEYQSKGSDALWLIVRRWQVKLCDPLVIHGPYLSALAMALPHNKALYKSPVISVTVFTCIVILVRRASMNLPYNSMSCCITSTCFMLSAAALCVSSRWESLPAVIKVCELTKSPVLTLYWAGTIHGMVLPCIHSWNKLTYSGGQIKYAYVPSTYMGSLCT